MESTTDLEPYRARIEAIGALEPGLQGLGDSAIQERAGSLAQRARQGQPLDNLAVETFALAREASRRALGLRPFDVQLACGLALHEGRVAEMGTGEGKTLAAVAPVSLHALAGHGAHVLTFNDYLARRDAAWMGPVYELLGLSVGAVQEGMGAPERRGAYRSDVTYLTAKEAAFDLLRDGLCFDPGSQVHRPFHFALVDEADSILIDEARIPLVIAGSARRREPGLGRLADLARRLDPDLDVDTDEYARNIFLTEGGVTKVEEELVCGDLFAFGNVNLLAAVRNALHARFLLHRDVDYIVRRGAVELVDELTGRVAEKRQWPDGLQAAVEAKEGLRLGADGRILASITLQHFLQLYPDLCGMTATALSSARELSETYRLEVAPIPPHRPCVRHDHPDLIYSHREARDRAVAEEIVRLHASGRPVLAGTVSVADSERLAAALRRRGLTCSVLNARNDEEEAAIVAQAGALGAVTISTNMAGRGTDIRLGGSGERQRERVVALGGLFVLGTNRHESRRIDAQLRGRAGRQGDPGDSRFFISLEDEILRRYGIERLIPRKLFPPPSDEPTGSRIVRREVDRAQRIVEGQSFEIRKRLYAFSEILEKQRRYLQEWRQEVLTGSAELNLLERERGTRRGHLVARLGPTALDGLEARLTLLAIDRCWSEYLTQMQSVRDESHLVVLDGREPLAEFYRTAIGSFERLLERIDETILESFDALEIGEEGIDWDVLNLRRPAATWTYLVSDDSFGNNLLLTLANRPAWGLWGVLLLWPLLFVWGLYLRWRRRGQKRKDRVVN